jgi:hypothetical protein
MEIVFKDSIFENIENPNKFAKDIAEAINNTCNKYNIENNIATITAKFKGDFKGEISENISYAEIKG